MHMCLPSLLFASPLFFFFKSPVWVIDFESWVLLLVKLEFLLI